MKGRDHNRKKSTNGAKTRTTYEDLRRNRKEETPEFVAVPANAMGFVIGKKGNTIKEIQEKTGTRITQTNNTATQSGFYVWGGEGQRAQARELINQKVAKMPTVNYGSPHASPGQLVKIPDQFKKHVRGPGGDNLRNVSTLTGAEVRQREDQLYVRGEKKEVQHAEYLLRTKVAAARVRPNRICVYIDERHLPHGCELKLVRLNEKERMILPGAQSQYRLKPVDGYESQGACALNQTIPYYDTSLTQSVLSSLHNIKLESDVTCRADMWSHFGKVIIRDPDEVDVDETWNVTDALDKLQATPHRRNEWLVAFNEGVELEDKVVCDTFGEQNEEDFIARYDLSLLTPRSRPMRCKVWVTNKDVKQKLEEIPIPFRDLKNVVEELRFEDEPTRLRCRGWIVLQSKKFLQANIIFPGSDIDCRLHIRARSDNAIEDESGVHEKEATHLLSQYLSKLTFTDADGLSLPEGETLPQGFLFNHWRCSRRTLYTPRPGFTMIVSKERSWNCDVREEDSRETTDIHLHCEKWDQALSEEDWEPEEIVAQFPEFLQFMRQVQEFVSSHCHRRAEDA